jgi:hypothetical protein
VIESTARLGDAGDDDDPDPLVAARVVDRRRGSVKVV